MTERRTTLRASMRRRHPDTKVDPTAVDRSQRIEITLQLRRRPGADVERRIDRVASRPLADRTYVSREDFAALAGIYPADIPRVEAFANEHRLTIVEISMARRTVKLSGTIGDMDKAFGVRIKRYRSGTITYRGHGGWVRIPADMRGIIVRVLGLEDRHIMAPRSRLRLGAKETAERAGASTARRRTLRPRDIASTGYPAHQVAEIYNFPPRLDGSGQTIALIELNDVYRNGNPKATGYSLSDLTACFKDLGLPVPSVTAIGVDGGANVAGRDRHADGEVMLDIAVAGATAPGAKLAVYFGTNTDDGFMQTLTTAIHDDVRKPSIVSISWGETEDGVSPQLLQGLEEALQDAVLLGVTVCIATGDDGSAGVPRRGRDPEMHVLFPASSTYALACGGTTLDSSSGPNRPVETVWNRGPRRRPRRGAKRRSTVRRGATCGGVSGFFPKPSYQAGFPVPRPEKRHHGGRGVPDVSGHADPGYAVVVHGERRPIGGTSAVAPLWAGLLARINQSKARNGIGPVGFVNPLLYGKVFKAKAFHDVTSGNNDIHKNLNGRFSARAGWDPCTGLGTPDGVKILTAL